MNNTPSEFEKLSEPFRALIGNEGINYQILDLLPVPIEIFSPDGTIIFLNRAWLELNNIQDPDLIVGKYNVKNDPVCLEIMGQDNIDILLRGESGSYSNFPIPIQDLVDRDIIDEKPFEAATTDIFCLPIWDGDIFVCSIVFFTVKNMYKGREDVAIAQEYIDAHWQEEFDLEQTARSVNLSSRHFRRIFKEVTGSTPLEYYKDIKIKKLQEKLLDGRLSIEQAFDACGVSSRGAYQRLFKEKMDMTPNEYRKANNPHRKNPK